ncbi:MAG: hypothetical protein CMP59_11840 [Flavobacteriales bacterium]|nr:hypothetical protein [Flavobacteriales bacterium]|tara:strand:- start:907 stop:1350 length:444 start_codon:yes stop_codon:yes gene_type:complete
MIKDNPNQLFVSENDLNQINQLILSHQTVDSEVKDSLSRLKYKIGKARILSTIVELNIAGLYSIITVSTPFGRKVDLQIVMPDEANLNERKLSIISTLGVAIFGNLQGAKAIWKFPEKDEIIEIIQIDNSRIKQNSYTSHVYPSQYE